MKQIRMNNIHS
jgi:hypothetical protein